MVAAPCPHRTRANWMTVVTLGGMLWGLAAPLHAQEQKIGTVLGVPLAELDRFEEANASPGLDRSGRLVPSNTVRILHVSPVAGSPFNTAIATVSVTLTEGGAKAQQVYFPLQANGGISPLYAQINAYDSFLNAEIVTLGGRAVLQVDVHQDDPRNLDLSRTRFILVPADRVGSLEVTNPSVKFTSVHRQRISLGDNLLWVDLVAIDEGDASNILIPSVDLADAMLALNSNIVVQNSTGSSFYQVTTVAVR
jgi:hypothetical protein